MASFKGRMISEHRRPTGRASVSETETTPLIAHGNGTPLNSSSTQSSTVWGSHDSILISYPKQFVHLTYKTVTSNYVNVLLVFVPAGIICGAIGVNPTVVFLLNFLAIVPLAALLSFATEELSATMGQTIGGLMNASFGNAIELIVSIIALINGEIRIVQASMLGSILSNILLVLGCCFIAGGWNVPEPEFQITAALTMSSLLAVSSASLIIPAALVASLNDSTVNVRDTVLILSRGTSIILLLLYIMYLYFQLKSHAYMFDEEQGPEDEEEEERILKPIPATIALILITLLVSVCADYLVNSIDAVVSSTGMSRTFIGLILLPIVGNAAEHVTAVIVAYKGKMDLAIGVAIGSSLQIAIFVTPFLVILGWIINQDMTLHFHGFETVVFFISILVVNYLIQDGKTNYLEGLMCIGTYIIIALAFYMYPDDATDIGGMISKYFHN